MAPERHPLHVMLHQHMGVDSFALDGDDTPVLDPWHDRPHLAKTRC